MLELAPRLILRINSKARSEGNILGGSSYFINRTFRQSWLASSAIKNKILNEYSVVSMRRIFIDTQVRQFFSFIFSLLFSLGYYFIALPL